MSLKRATLPAGLRDLEVGADVLLDVEVEASLLDGRLNLASDPPGTSVDHLLDFRDGVDDMETGEPNLGKLLDGVAHAIFVDGLDQFVGVGLLDASVLVSESTNLWKVVLPATGFGPSPLRHALGVSEFV